MGEGGRGDYGRGEWVGEADCGGVGTEGGCCGGFGCEGARGEGVGGGGGGGVEVV